MFAAESFSWNGRGSFIYVEHQTNDDISVKLSNTYAFTRFIELQSLNMYSWSDMVVEAWSAD